MVAVQQDEAEAYFDAAGEAMAADIASGAHVPDAVSTVTVIVPDDGAGVLIHPDGTPLTPEEIAAQEAAELADDDYLDDDPAGTLTCTPCGALVSVDDVSLEEVSEAQRTPEVFLCQECMDEAVLPGDVAIAMDDSRKWGPDA